MALSWGNSQQMAWRDGRVGGKILYFVQVSAYYVRPSVAYSWPITANWLRCLWAEIESGGETEGGGGRLPRDFLFFSAFTSLFRRLLSYYCYSSHQRKKNILLLLGGGGGLGRQQKCWRVVPVNVCGNWFVLAPTFHSSEVAMNGANGRMKKNLFFSGPVKPDPPEPVEKMVTLFNRWRD